MSTRAESFSGKYYEAMALKPMPFMVDGKDFAMVTPDGKLVVVSSMPLEPNKAVDFRAWIKTNFMAGGST